MDDALGTSGALGDTRSGLPQPGPRVLVAIRDPSLERPLLGDAEGEHAAELRIVGRALDGDSLLTQVDERAADAAIVSADLPGLTTALVRSLGTHGLAILVVPTGGEPLPPAWEELGARAVSLPLDPGDVARTIQSVQSERTLFRASGEPTANESSSEEGHLLAVVSGKGSPGKTTVALSLAVGLARRGEEVVLVDLDLSGGDIVAYLGLDPRANLFTLAHAAAGQRTLPEDVVTRELQLWGETPWVWVLVGIARPPMAAAITPAFVQVLLTYLRRHFQHSVIDLAALPRGPEVITRAVLEEAERILVVCGGDLTAAWHTAQAIETLHESFGVGAERLGLVINQHDAAWQPASDQIARAMEWEGEILGTIPYDHHAMQDALRDQRPLILSRRPVGRALDALAGRIQAEQSAAGDVEWSSSSPRPRRGWRPHLSLGWRRS